MNIYQKTNALRMDFLSQAHRKTGKNAFAGFNYFELPDFIPQVLADCIKHGICPHFYINDAMAFLDLYNVEKPEEKLTFSAPFGGCQLKGCHEVQNIGASITYMRRYCWGMALELVENDAVDASEPIKQPAFNVQNAVSAMREAPDMESLKSIFGNSWKQATAEEKEYLKVTYDELKAIFEQAEKE